MKQLVIFPKGTLSPKDKERMSKEGYLAIEADDPSKIHVPLPTSLSDRDIASCALEALHSGRTYVTSAQEVFSESLYRRFQKLVQQV